jgi:hypothetical protein
LDLKVGSSKNKMKTNGPEVDWDQKASATFHTKKSKRPPKFPQKAPFLTFCMGD